MKKIITFVLIAAMMLTMLVANVSAAAWDGTSVSASLKGEGTVASPYLVESAADLAFLAKSVNEGTTYEGKYITQTADIDLGGKAWKAIGDNTNSFMGIYDGKGHEIKDFTYTVVNAFAGFFGCVKSTEANQAGILNLNLSGKVNAWEFAAASDTFVGGLAGKLEGKAGKNVVVANCVVDVDIDVTTPVVTDKKFVDVGGFGGWNAYVSVVNSEYKGDIKVVSDGRYLMVGGFLGITYNDIAIENSVFSGSVDINAKMAGMYATAGGFIGRRNGAANRSCVIKNSVCSGSVNAVSTGLAYASGFVAHAFNANTRNLTIENCANTGKIHGETVTEGQNAYAGGMIGYENVGYVTVKNCVNKGEVTAAGVNKAMLPGGILGVSNFANKTSKYDGNTSTGNVVGWTNATAEIVTNSVDNADVAVVDAAIRTIEDTQKATKSVTLNDVKYDFVVAAPVVPTPPTPSTPSNPNTGDVTSVIVLALVAVSCGAALTLKKTR